MLSNPITSLHTRQRQHRRQNSTPTAFDSVKVHDLPNIQRNHGHRRGMSLDQRRRQSPPQDLNKVRNTNQGYQTTQQHILRETQQQRLARPGQHFSNFDNDENYLHSPIVTPHRQSFDSTCASPYEEPVSSPQYAYGGPINTTMQVDPNLLQGGNDFENPYSSEVVLTPSAFMNFTATFDNGQSQQHSAGHSRSSSASRRISGGIVDRVSQFEHLSMKSPRPITPPNQNVTGYFPPTPMNTPFHRVGKHEQMNHRFLDDYDTSMEETLKPKASQRARGVFEDMRKESEARSFPTPPHTGQLSTPCTFDTAPMPTGNFLNMTNLNLEFMKQEQSENCSPQSSNLSYNSSPEMPDLAMFGNSYINKSNTDHQHMSYPEPEMHGLRRGSSPTEFRRSESVDSINIDETITETGITIDDIAGFISGPDPVDGRWLCLFPECKKSFGRKENIKSHVQTHLGDRQFQCPHCKKCFVRQHDLKRHAKIHSGVKPYPCQCGNSFARHDALTRHRQRGMCIGAFEGVVKKTVKRGRPRKNRPDNEERLEKSSRTRSKNKAMSSTSSTTGGSDSTYGQSPRSDLDDILDEKPFGDYGYIQTSSSMENGSQQYSLNQSPAQVHVACVTPQMTHRALSPSAFSNHSTYNEHRPSVSSEHLPSHPASPAKSVHHSPYHSPPGLCESSSSPAPSNHYYEMDHGVSQTEFKGLSNITEDDDEMFLEAFAAASNNNAMTQLEQDSDLLMHKYGQEYNNGGDDLFRSENDVFFGSP